MTGATLTREQKLIQIASHFYKARASLRRLFPQKYDELAEPFRQGIRDVADAGHIDVFSAALELVKTYKESSHPQAETQILWVLAAAVDVSEQT